MKELDKTKYYRKLKRLSELDLEQKSVHGCYGYECRETGCFINDDMAHLFDGVTVRAYHIDDHLYAEGETSLYGYRDGSWSYNENWFVEDYNGWVTEEDFAL